MTGSPAHDQFLSSRSEVEPFYAMDILARANMLKEQGHDIDFLCVGQPAAQAPLAAREAAAQLMASGSIGYTDAAGRLDLREGISEHIKRSYGQSVSPSRIFVATGSSAGFSLAFLSLFDAGDAVAIATPGYPAYRNILKSLSLKTVEIQTTADDRWAITPELVRKAHKDTPLKGILVASPANPSGTMMTPDALKELIACCDELGIRFISDEIYHGLTYSDETGLEEASALQFSDTCIVINSFSKFFCMTGWRVGWMVLPETMIRPVERLAQSLYISAPEISQVAALAALDCMDELETIRQGYLKNRNLLLKRLPELGFAKILPIDGAFYAYADASQHTDNTMDFAFTLLEQAGVAATPGFDFDQERGNAFMRFSFAGNFDVIDKALNKMESFLNQR